MKQHDSNGRVFINTDLLKMCYEKRIWWDKRSLRWNFVNLKSLFFDNLAHVLDVVFWIFKLYLMYYLWKFKSNTFFETVHLYLQLLPPPPFILFLNQLNMFESVPLLFPPTTSESSYWSFYSIKLAFLSPKHQNQISIKNRFYCYFSYFSRTNWLRCDFF